MFKRFLNWWTEWRLLRECNNSVEFDAYAKEKLKTLDNVAWYVWQTIEYRTETPPVWNSADEALKTKIGNCTEISCVGKVGAIALGYWAENLCVYGVDPYDGERKGHAVAAFFGKGKKGFMEGGSVFPFKDDTEWVEIARSIRPEWGAFSWCFKNDKGITV